MLSFNFVPYAAVKRHRRRGEKSILLIADVISEEKLQLTTQRDIARDYSHDQSVDFAMLEP